MNVNIAEKTIKDFAKQIFIWAVENGIFLNFKNKMLPIKSKSIDIKRVIEYKIEEIGPSPLLRIFSDEAMEDQLKSGINPRFSQENILLKDYFLEENYNFFYLSNQWTEDSSNLKLSKLIDLINNALQPNFLCGYTVINNNSAKYVFYVVDLHINQEIADEVVMQIQSSENFSNQELTNNFLFRLRTQDRPYSKSTGFSFYTSLFYKLNKRFFEDWCINQIQKLTVYSKDGNTIFFESIEELKFDKNGLFFRQINSIAFAELYFKYKNELFPHKDYVKQLKFLTIDHVDSVNSILLKNANCLPVLKKISDLTLANFGIKSKLNIREINFIISLLTEVEKNDILKELNIVGSAIKLQFLPDVYNKSKGR